MPITLLAGQRPKGHCDGVGAAVQFDGVHGLVASNRLPPPNTGNKLIACDLKNNCLRMIDLNSKQVTTLTRNNGWAPAYGWIRDSAGRSGGFTGTDTGEFRAPRKLVFDRSPTVKPHSALYVTEQRGVIRLDLASGERRILPTLRGLFLSGIDCAPTGILIVSCLNTNSLYTLDGFRAVPKLLVGDPKTGPDFKDGSSHVARFRSPLDICIFDHERCLFVADRLNYRIRRVALPYQLFVP